MNLSVWKNVFLFVFLIAGTKYKTSFKKELLSFVELPCGSETRSNKGHFPQVKRAEKKRKKKIRKKNKKQFFQKTFLFFISYFESFETPPPIKKRKGPPSLSFYYSSSLHLFFNHKEP